MKSGIGSKRVAFTVFSVLLILVSVGLFFHSLFAQRYLQDAATTIATGKTQLFQKTVSGALSSYQTFQGAYGSDYAAAGDADKIKIRVYLAATRMLDLILRNDGGNVDTLTELLAQYGITRTEDAEGRLESVKFNAPLNKDEKIILPSGAPASAETLRAFFAGPFLSAVNASIADMDAAIALCPSTEGIDREIVSKTLIDPDDATQPDIELDAGDYYLFRSMLKFFKAYALMNAGYNAEISIQEIVSLANVDIGMKMFRLLLDRYPDFLKVRTGGATDLLLAKAALIDAVTDYETASDSIRNDQSTTSGAEELIALENADRGKEDFYRGQMAKIKDSLQNNRAVAMGSSTETWNFPNDFGVGLQMTFEDGFSQGSYTSSGSLGNYATLDYAIVNGSDVTLHFTIHSPEVGWSEFHGTLNSDRTQIPWGTFNGWSGWTGNFGGGFNNAVRTSVEAKTQNLNFFPLFGDGSTAPKALRDLLPQLNDYGYPMAGTMGQGLDNDATLGGILPDMTQNQWVREMGEIFQPAGAVTIASVADGAISVQDATTDDWSGLSLAPVFDYLYGETGDPASDIRILYLARDTTYLYVRIDTAGTIPASAMAYGLSLKNLPGDQYELAGDLKVQVYYDGLQWLAALYKVNNQGSMAFVSNLGSADFQVFGNHVEMRAALAQLGELSGRFIGVFAKPVWGGNGDQHDTCLQIQPTASVTGTLSVPGYDGVGVVRIGVFEYSANFSTDPENRLGSLGIYPDGTGNLPATYTISGLPVGQKVFVSVFWDRDDNGVVSPGDYTNFYQPFTTAAGVNTLNLAASDDHPAYPAPQFTMAWVQHEKQTTGSWDVLMAASLTGPSPEDVTVTVTGPGGEYTLTPGNWVANRWGLIYKNTVSWLPDGDYTFTALDSLGRKAEKAVHYAASTSLPSVTVMTPSGPPSSSAYTGTVTPTLNWTSPDGQPHTYQVWIVDYNNASNGVIWYASDLTQDTSITVPAGVLLPDTPYAWFVRLYDSATEPMNFTMSPVKAFYTGSLATEPAFVSKTVRIGGQPPSGTITSYSYWVDAKLPGVAPWHVTSWQLTQGSTTYASGTTMPFFNRTDDAFFEASFSRTYVLPTASDYLFTMTFNRSGTPVTLTRSGLSFAFSDVGALDVTSLVPSNDYYFKTSMPTFSWGPVDDANAYYRLRIYESRGRLSLYTSDWSRNTSATVPAGVLKAGGTYYWTVQTTPTIDPSYVNLYVNTEGNSGNKALFRFTLHPPQTGDLNGNGEVDLADAVLALKVLSGMTVTAAEMVGAQTGDVDADNRIGLPEAIYILQAISGLRP